MNTTKISIRNKKETFEFIQFFIKITKKHWLILLIQNGSYSASSYVKNESDGMHAKPSEIVENFSKSDIKVMQNGRDNKL